MFVSEEQTLTVSFAVAASRLARLAGAGWLREVSETVYHGRRARDRGVVQRPGDPGDAVSDQPFGEHPPDDGRDSGVWLKAVRPPPQVACA